MKRRPAPVKNPALARTIGEMILRAADTRPDFHFMNYFTPGGRLRRVSWARAMPQMAAIAAWWDAHGIQSGRRVCCITPNSPGMFVWEFAAMGTGRISAPLYGRTRPEEMRRLLPGLNPAAVLVEDAPVKTAVAALLGARVRVVTLAELDEIMEGSAPVEPFRKAVRRVRPDEVALIQHTSGTSGDMKGVMLTHRNLMSEQAAFTRIWDIPDGSRFLSYLPWHHSFGGIFERVTALARGAAITLEPSNGKDVRALLRTWERVRPTHFFSVPKMYVKLMSAARRSPRARKILFHRDLRLLFTAGAPLPSECTRYFEGRGAAIMEGWGLTETSPTVTLTRLDEPRIHTIVGHPIPGVRVRISPEGEILVKGPNVMKGYFRRPALTRRAFDARGWFHTGDLGEMTPAGLRIICRKDGVFKLLNGLKVPSLPIEEALTLSSPHIAYTVAMGQGRDHAAVLVFPEAGVLPACRRGGREIMRRLRVEIEAGLRPFVGTAWEVRAAAVICEELSMEAGELTPTQKIVRRTVLERFHRWEEAIYHPRRYPGMQKHILRFNK